jgi:hypothetical protein
MRLQVKEKLKKTQNHSQLKKISKTVSEQSTGGHFGKHFGVSRLGENSPHKMLSLLEAHFPLHASWWHIAGKEHTKFNSSLQLTADAVSLNE